MKKIKIITGVIFFTGLFVSHALPDSSQSIETNENLKDIGFWLIIIPLFVFVMDTIFKRKIVF